jgi:HD-GYP domain-containing protein (c-di-GMP phosphodiesterase class II)
MMYEQTCNESICKSCRHAVAAENNATEYRCRYLSEQPHPKQHEQWMRRFGRELCKPTQYITLCFHKWSKKLQTSTELFKQLQQIVETHELPLLMQKPDVQSITELFDQIDACIQKTILNDVAKCKLLIHNLVDQVVNELFQSLREFKDDIVREAWDKYIKQCKYEDHNWYNQLRSIVYNCCVNKQHDLQSRFCRDCRWSAKQEDALYCKNFNSPNSELRVPSTHWSPLNFCNSPQLRFQQQCPKWEELYGALKTCVLFEPPSSVSWPELKELQGVSPSASYEQLDACADYAEEPNKDSDWFSIWQHLPPERRMRIMRQIEEEVKIAERSGIFAKNSGKLLRYVYGIYCEDIQEQSLLSGCQEIQERLEEQYKIKVNLQKLRSIRDQLTWFVERKNYIMSIRPLVVLIIAKGMREFNSFVYEWRLEDVLKQCMQQLIRQPECMRHYEYFEHNELCNVEMRKQITEIVMTAIRELQDHCIAQKKKLLNANGMYAHQQIDQKLAIWETHWDNLTPKQELDLFVHVYLNLSIIKCLLGQEKNDSRKTKLDLKDDEIVDSILTWAVYGQSTLDSQPTMFPNYDISNSDALIRVLARKNKYVLFQHVLFYMISKWPILGEGLPESLNSKLQHWLRALLNGLDTHDFYTRCHSERTTLVLDKWLKYIESIEKSLCDDLCTEITQRYNTTWSQFKSALSLGILLHDVGKLFVSRDILLSSEKFNLADPNEENSWWIRRHVADGYALVMLCLHSVINRYSDMTQIIDYRLESEVELQELKKVQQIISDTVYYHHEAWEGQGYIHNLQATDIPLPARIAAIVDAYEALCSPRSYRPAFTEEVTRSNMARPDIYSRKKYDPNLLACFWRHIDQKHNHQSLIPSTEENVVMWCS